MDNNAIITKQNAGIGAKQNIGIDIKTDTINIDTISIDTINIDTNNIEIAKELFNSCRYNEAEQMFSKICCSEAAAWRIFCHIITGDIGRKGGKVGSLLQELIKYQKINIDEVVTMLKILIDEYGNTIDRKTRNKAITSLCDTFNGIMKDKMAIAISGINKRALEIVKGKGYIPSIYDDKTIPLRILNIKLGKYRYRIRHYKPEEIVCALKVINNENFLQEVVNDYMSMVQYNTTNINREYLDTRNQDVLRYIKSLYISNTAYEKELKIIKSTDRLQFIEFLKKLNQKGWLRVTMLSSENTKYFNMANDAEKAICEIEIERVPTASIVLSLEHEDVIEKRGYLIHDNIVNQISKEDIALGDIINRFTYEYVGPVLGTIYCDN